MRVGLPHDHRRSEPHSRGQLRVMSCFPGKAQRVATRFGQMRKCARPGAITCSLRQKLDPRLRFGPWPPIYPPRIGPSRYISGSRRHPVSIPWPFDLGELGQVADFWVLTCRQFPRLIQVFPIGQGWGFSGGVALSAHAGTVPRSVLSRKPISPGSRLGGRDGTHGRPAGWSARVPCSAAVLRTLPRPAAASDDRRFGINEEGDDSGGRFR